MQFNDFINKWNNQPCDFDGWYGTQCVDLYDQYCQDVIGCPIILINGASDIWENYPLEYFNRVLNTPEAVPQEGDVIIWDKTTTLPFGHVSVFISGDINSFTSFDQNWPIGSKCHYQEHNYSGVLGWLHPKIITDTTDVNYKGYDLTNRDSMRVAVDILVKLQSGELIDKIKYDADIKTKEETISNLNSQIQKLEKDTSLKDSAIGSLKQQVLIQDGELKGLRTQAQMWTEKQKIYTQMELNYQSDKLSWAQYQQTTNRKVAQLENTSYKTIKTDVLAKEVFRRLLHIKEL